MNYSQAQNKNTLLVPMPIYQMTFHMKGSKVRNHKPMCLSTPVLDNTGLFNRNNAIIKFKNRVQFISGLSYHSNFIN